MDEDMDMEQEERAVTPRGIKNSNANGRDATLATPQLDGRQVIYSDVEAVTRSNVVQVLDDALMVHMGNRAEIEFLYNYVRGNQPILDRIKDVRPEICNRIVINLANKIVTFKVASFVGEPVQLVSRRSDEGITDGIEKLNSMLISENKASKDMDLAYWMFTCGVGYRLVLRDKAEAYMADELYDEAPFEIYTLDPRNTFVIRRNDVTERVIAGVTFTFRDDYTVKYTVYTENETFYLTGSMLSAGKLDKTVTHNFGMVPIVEYPCNALRMGAFEVVIDLLDAINLTESNRLDGVEQFIQALMVFENVDIDEGQFEMLREKGAIKISSRDGLTSRVYYLNEQLDQGQTQTLIDDMSQLVLQIVGLPSQGNANTSDSSNNGAVIMKNGWWDAEARMKEVEGMWRKSETDLLKMLLKICREANAFDLRISDIMLKFLRRSYEDRMSKAQTLSMLLAAKVPPLLAFQIAEIVPDSEAAARQYEDYQEEQERKLLEEMRRTQETTQETGNTEETVVTEET